jgi:hypothetical protein
LTETSPVAPGAVPAGTSTTPLVPRMPSVVDGVSIFMSPVLAT